MIRPVGKERTEDEEGENESKNATAQFKIPATRGRPAHIQAVASSRQEWMGFPVEVVERGAGVGVRACGVRKVLGLGKSVLDVSDGRVIYSFIGVGYKTLSHGRRIGDGGDLEGGVWIFAFGGTENGVAEIC